MMTFKLFNQLFISALLILGMITLTNAADMPDKNQPPHQTKKGSTAPGATATGALSSKATRSERQGLLLPAVQAAREAARQPAQTNTNKNNLRSRSSKQAADTSCSGINSCNDMIATCIAMGGNMTPTSYDPSTGSPNGATCFSPGQ